jgi:hypothetical protein
MIIDYRCPRCDRVVRGREEVVLVKKIPSPLPEQCKHCGAMLTHAIDRDDLGECLSFYERRRYFGKE